MKHPFALLAAIATTTVSLFIAAAPAYAADAGYRVVPASAPKSANVVLRDTLWRCGPEACTTGAITSRPAIACAAAARELGKITSFSAKGEELPAEALAKCNEKAR